MRVSIIIPALNEGKTILDVLHRCLALPLDKEILVVDNNSSDDTRLLVERLIADNALAGKVFLLTEQVKGKGRAYRKGIESARGELIVFQDADSEYAPESIPEMVELLRDNSVVFGRRVGSLYQIAVSAFIANKALLTLVNRRFNVSLADIFTGQRAFRRDALRDLDIQSNGFDVETEITMKTLAMGYKWVEMDVPYSPRDREAGKKIGVRSFISILVRYFLLGRGALQSSAVRGNGFKSQNT
jgi:glycosyltransferase involved in cell wall biosynthesis